MVKGMNKKGADMMINIIIVVALLLVAFFSVSYFWFGNWSNFTDWLGGSNKATIGPIAFNCNQKCTLKDPTYCTSPEGVTFKKGDKEQEFTCKQLETIPGSTVDACPVDNIDCSVEIINCDGLKVFCQGIDPAKCNYGWMEQAALTTAKADTGTGKTYKEVVDSTLRVTDATVNTGKFCVRTILN